MSHYFQQRFAEVIHLLHSNKKIIFNQECYKLKSDARAVGGKTAGPPGVQAAGSDLRAGGRSSQALNML